MQIPILMYHSVSDRSIAGHNLWTISSSAFESHLEFLKNQAYIPLTVSSLISSVYDNSFPLPYKPIVLTFDDGLADFFTDALPILDKYGFPATLYIPTAYVGQGCHWLKPDGDENYSMLSWSEIQEIAQHGIECGSHGHSHIQFDILPIKKMKEEVRNSKDILEQHLQTRIKSFAYPYGLSCATLRKIVQQSGYSSGCAVKHSMMTLMDDRYALARIAITSNLSQAGFQDILTGKGLNKSYKNERMRTKIYRIVRKLKTRLKMG